MKFLLQRRKNPDVPLLQTVLHRLAEFQPAMSCLQEGHETLSPVETVEEGVGFRA